MKGLADRIVALGVGHKGVVSRGYYLPSDEGWDGGLTTDKFTHSWEVAGALMEKCWTKGFFIQIDRRKELPSITVTLDYNEDGSAEVISQCGTASLPHAINLACVEALEE